LLEHLVRDAAGEAEGALVLLHGRGADEHDLFALLDVLDPERRLAGITLAGPLRLPPGGKHWYVVPRVGFPDPDSFAASYAALQRALDDDLALDPATTVLGGFSQGAVMALALGLGAGRPRPAGILALSGFIPSVPGWDAGGAELGGLPVALAHGTQDPVISVDFARAARAQLEAAGADLLYRETPMGHTIDPRVVPELSAWLACLPPSRSSGS
jgi:phospholipase/carboxylesterase